MGYTLNTGPFDIRPTGKSVGESGYTLRDECRDQCVDVYIEPPFIPGEGLKRALGLSDTIVLEHVATTEESTHLYFETKRNDIGSNNSKRIAAVLDRLEEYLNPNGTYIQDSLVDSFRSKLL